MSAITHLPRWSALHFVFSPKFANIAIPHILICGSSIEYSTTSKIFGIKSMHSQLSNALSDVFIAYLDAEIYSFEVAKFLQSPAFQGVFIYEQLFWFVDLEKNFLTFSTLEVRFHSEVGRLLKAKHKGLKNFHDFSLLLRLTGFVGKSRFDCQKQKFTKWTGKSWNVEFT